MGRVPRARAVGACADSREDSDKQLPPADQRRLAGGFLVSNSGVNCLVEQDARLERFGAFECGVEA